MLKININQRSEDAATYDHVQKCDLSTPAQQTEIESPSIQYKFRTHVYKQHAPAVVNYRSVEFQNEKCKVN